MKKFCLFYLIIFLFICTSCASSLDFNEDNIGKYYINEDGSRVIDDWKTIGGKWYYFDKSGYMVCNNWVDKVYYMDEHGVMVRDKWYVVGETKYYFKKDGKFAANEVLQINKKEYKFDYKGNSTEIEVSSDEKNN